GQFKPGPENKAYIGKTDEISKIIEYKVETVCTPSKIKDVIKALKKSHPYECPAYGVLKMELI
ncbi:MAG: NGG1p interacting factor NIF3, partial [Gammaproteobacteria bacterium]|nr:NGG1p interacting factor NIF3 [Gammaproteobacteria bacterium]